MNDKICLNCAYSNTEQKNDFNDIRCKRRDKFVDPHSTCPFHWYQVTEDLYNTLRGNKE